MCQSFFAFEKGEKAPPLSTSKTDCLRSRKTNFYMERLACYVHYFRHFRDKVFMIWWEKRRSFLHFYFTFTTITGRYNNNYYRQKKLRAMLHSFTFLLSLHIFPLLLFLFHHLCHQCLQVLFLLRGRVRSL